MQDRQNHRDYCNQGGALEVHPTRCWHSSLRPSCPRPRPLMSNRGGWWRRRRRWWCCPHGCWISRSAQRLILTTKVGGRGGESGNSNSVGGEETKWVLLTTSSLLLHWSGSRKCVNLLCFDLEQLALCTPALLVQNVNFTRKKNILGSSPLQLKFPHFWLFSGACLVNAAFVLDGRRTTLPAATARNILKIAHFFFREINILHNGWLATTTWHTAASFSLKVYPPMTLVLCVSERSARRHISLDRNEIWNSNDDNDDDVCENPDSRTLNANSSCIKEYWK